MKTTLVCLFASCALFGGVYAQNLVDQKLPGQWKENQYERINLNNFLYEMGMGWIKRVYVTSTSWENTQKIVLNDTKFYVTGTKGPYASEFKFKLVPNNSTRTNVNLGELGGATKATAEYVGSNTLMTYLRDVADGLKLFLTANRTVDPLDTDHMIYTTHHLPSNTKLISHFYRQ